ncbi:low molecular weight phosphatase family protein [Neoactinobaculum massilliense]|uniref:arsenate-mycothiol transferase ArsC n=1 Tax=Neoactinobaculum massilliense TaxID=2364794 RepID=UPI001F14FD50|nr:low molecular weight phosphatase family protein [Neoactinobaculum massilliense]
MSTSVTPPISIMFACRQNAGRSQLAAAIARSLATPGITVRSAGTEPAASLHPAVLQVLTERGLTPDHEPRLLAPEDVEASDWVITMGCGETCPIYPGKHYEDWDVPDPAGQPVARVREIAAIIEERVRDLLTRI